MADSDKSAPSSREVTRREEIDITPGPATLEGEYAEKLPTSDKGYRRLGMLILLLPSGALAPGP